MKPSSNLVFGVRVMEIVITVTSSPNPTTGRGLWSTEEISTSHIVIRLLGHESLRHDPSETP